MEFYNSKIQLDKEVIDDIFKVLPNPDIRMLVFGLGYDSKMWYHGNKNTVFVENKQEYIDLNKNEIPAENIIKYEYKNINVNNSFDKTDETIREYVIPKSLLEKGPFDIILIDGPEGYSKTTPGRLIPCYWSTLLSKSGGFVYIDDATRPLETYCIQKYYEQNKKRIFKNRLGCVKICT